MKKSQQSIFWIAFLLILLGQLAWFIYLPALPIMFKVFNTTHQKIQLVAIVFCAGMGIAQFLFGPLSDYYGRKPLATIGLLIFVCGSLMSALAPTIHWLLNARLLQGIGAGACSVLGRVVPRDVFQGQDYAKASSQLSIGLALTPLLAPVLGSYLLVLFSWRANFVVIFIVALLVAFLIQISLPETNLQAKQKSLSWRSLLVDFQQVLFHKQFLFNLLLSAFTLSGEIVFNLTAPFLMQEQMHITPVEYGWLLLAIACCFMLGAKVSRWLLQKNWQSRIILNLGVVFLFAANLLMLAFSFSLGIISLIVPMFIYTFGTGLVYPNAAAGAMDLFTERAGVAGSLLGSIQLFIVALVTFVFSAIPIHSVFTLGLILLILSFASLALIVSLTYTNDAYLVSSRKSQ